VPPRTGSEAGYQPFISDLTLGQGAVSGTVALNPVKSVVKGCRYA
jgi:hypothetical protein